MLAQHDETAMHQIIEVVSQILQKHGMNDPVPVDVDLARFGMTSIDMVELMLGIEAEFDITIPPAEITLRNFSSVAAMKDLVARLTSRQ